ncbi:hypothetical protein [uncultured Clostridium sp.]|uniref:hypothetical protein n=1 Tax=uncultured Clostridium sp. TaxID=59620 RepID=UPI00263A919F|nr:hypothetical protein [uncultured Clostridium sp.]
MEKKSKRGIKGLIMGVITIIFFTSVGICTLVVAYEEGHNAATNKVQKIKDTSGREWDGVIKNKKFSYNYSSYPDSDEKRYIIKNNTIVQYNDFMYINIEDDSGNIENIIVSEEYDETDVFLGDVYYDLFEDENSTNKKKVLLTSVQNIRLEQDQSITFKTIEDYKEELKNNSPKEGETGLKDYKFEVIEKGESGIVDKYITSNGEMIKEKQYCVVFEDYYGIVQSVYDENLYNTLEIGDEVLCDVIITYEKDSNIIDTNKMILKNIRKIEEDNKND